MGTAPGPGMVALRHKRMETGTEGATEGERLQYKVREEYNTGIGSNSERDSTAQSQHSRRKPALRQAT